MNLQQKTFVKADYPFGKEAYDKVATLFEYEYCTVVPITHHIHSYSNTCEICSESFELDHGGSNNSANTKRGGKSAILIHGYGWGQ